jgi:hypothetical protein
MHFDRSACGSFLYLLAYIHLGKRGVCIQCIASDRSALRRMGCICQRPGIQNPQNPQNPQAPQSTFLPAASTGIQGPPCPRTGGQPAADRVSFPSVATAELRLDHHHHLALVLRVGILGQWIMGNGAPWHRTVVTDRLTETQKYRTRPKPRAVRRCALGLRWASAGPPASRLQHPKATACRTQPTASMHSPGPPAHQLTRTSAHSTAKELSLPYPSLKRVSDVPGVGAGAPVPSRSSSSCRAGMVCAGRV